MDAGVEQLCDCGFSAEAGDTHHSKDCAWATRFNRSKTIERMANDLGIGRNAEEVRQMADEARTPLKPKEERNPVLVEREKTHGDFTKQAEWAQERKYEMRQTPNWQHLTGAQREALDMDVTKTSRILFGNPNEKDHWDDKAGYADLGGEACD